MTTDYIEQRAHRAQCVYEDAIRRGETEVDATFLADIACGAIPEPETLFPRFCAWCEAEGNETVVGETVVRGSHGICERHVAELLKGKGE